MGFEPVSVFVADAQEHGIEGVLVKIYDPTGSLFYMQAITDGDGVASFLLETLSYSMRFYKFQTGFTQPQQFVVLEGVENAFDVRGEPFQLPVATDARLCRCSGFFRDLNGAPKRYLDIHIMPKFAHIVLDGAIVAADQVNFRTDENGYASIDLIRGAQYEVYLETLGGDDLRCVSVPNLASCNLPNLLLPVIKEVVFTPEGPYAVAVGSEITLGVTVYDSAGVPLVGPSSADVNWLSSDGAVMGVALTQTSVVLRGITAGSAQLLATRQDQSIINIPSQLIVGQPVSVTVNP